MHQATYVTDAALAERFQLSRATIWRWAQSRRFPDPIKLAAGCTRWRLADVVQWESEQLKMSGAGGVPDSTTRSELRVSTGTTADHPVREQNRRVY